jgi:plastocyanin
MKNLITSCILLTSFVASYAAKHVVTNSGQTFSPASITINKNDTIQFQIGSFHNVVEVSQTTWNANGNTSNGGFTLPNGGGELKFTQAGTFYYVCEPHAANGMKGTITVNETTGVQAINFIDKFQVFALPGSNTIKISYNLNQSSVMRYSIYKLSGEKVYSKITSKHEVGEVNDLLTFEKELPMGVYILEAIVNNRKYTRKLFITPLN